MQVLLQHGMCTPRYWSHRGFGGHLIIHFRYRVFNIASVLVISYVLISLILWWKSGVPLQICCAQIDCFLALEPLRHLRYVVILVAGAITLLCIVYVQSLGAFRIKAVYAAQA